MNSDPRVEVSGRQRADQVSEHRRPQSRVPGPMQALAAWGWRIAAVAAGAYVVFWVVLRIWVVLVPLIIALFIAAALEPLVDRLRRHGVPSALATLVVFLAGLALGLLLFWWISTRVASQLGQLQMQVRQALDQVQQWLTSPPLNLSDQRLQQLESQILGVAGQGGVVQRALQRAPFVAQLATAFILVIFTVFFVLKDGPDMGGWIRERTPPRLRDDLTGISEGVRHVMRQWFVGTVAVGMINAVLIGIALVILGVPLVFPLAVITFFSAFVPVVGATVAGGLSALVGLVSGGMGTALWVIGATVLVQQVEGNLLQPLVMGAAVRLHPLVTIYMVTLGYLIGGIIGALFAVPFAAIATRIGHFYRTRGEATA